MWANCTKTRADQLKNPKNRNQHIAKGDYSVRSCGILENLCWPTMYDGWKMPINYLDVLKKEDKFHHAAAPEYLLN